LQSDCKAIVERFAKLYESNCKATAKRSKSNEGKNGKSNLNETIAKLYQSNCKNASERLQNQIRAIAKRL
jgi:hypothetical protein